MNAPTVTVIVPVYNVELYLNRCANSLLGQTYSNFELILVDDGSTDSSSEICDLLSSQDPRIRVCHKHNGGLSSARNEGLKHSRGEYISFVDSDDWVHSRFLEWLLLSLRYNDLEIAIGTFCETMGKSENEDAEDSVISVIETKEYWTTHRVNATISCGKLMKREICDNLIFPEGVLHEDEFTTYKLLFKVSQVAVVEAPVYFYFQRDNSIMGSAWSERNCDGLTALRDQRDYFEMSGFPDLEDYANSVYVSRIFENMNKAYDAGSYSQYRKLKGLLKKEIRMRRLPSIDILKDNDAAYISAAPIRARLLLHMNARAYYQNK